MSAQKGNELACVFGRLIRHLREIRAMSDAELASKSGLAQKVIAEFERAEREPDIVELFAIADACSVKPSWLTLATDTSEPIEVPGAARTPSVLRRYFVNGYLVAYQNGAGQCDCASFVATRECEHVYLVASGARCAGVPD